MQLCRSVTSMTQPEIEIRSAWRRVAGPEHEGCVDALLLRYAEPHRYYHTATHVMKVLRTVHDLSALEGRQPSPELIAAALYHDAVYDPRADDNEARSAALATRDLADVGWSVGQRDTVRALINATAAHVVDQAVDQAGSHGVNNDTAILLDADLAILGADPLTYQAYVTGVRAEYFFVDDEHWRVGRGRVLRGFLDNPRLFATEYMRVELEHRARANIHAELAALAPRSSGAV
jgi:predicted metal-dependent HD superfamily phosphohydrolase